MLDFSQNISHGHDTYMSQQSHVTYDFCEVLALVFGKLPRLHTQKPNVGATMEVLMAGFLDVKCNGLHLFQLWWIQYQ